MIRQATGTGRLPRAALLPLLVALLAACARLPDPGRLEGGATVVELPSRFHGSHVYVQVEVAGTDTAWLLLDSGAQVSVLDRRLADRLDAEARGTSRITGYGERRLEGQVLSDLPLRAIGSRPFTSHVPVVDLSALDPYAGLVFDGFLGAPLFHRFVVEIDYEARRVLLHDADRFRPRPGDVHLPLDVERGAPYADGAIVLGDGTVLRGRFVVDSGMLGALSLVTPFVSGHQLTERVGRTARQPFVGVGGRREELLARLAAFRMGPIVVDSPVAQLATSGAGAAAETDRAGAIGSDLLSRFTVVFDFRRNALHLRPNQTGDRPFAHNLSGASFVARGASLDTLVVDWIDEGSAAEAAGLAVGDVLQEVDGRPASTVRLWELRELLRGEAGSVVTLVVRRDGAPVTIRLELVPRI